MLRRFSLVLAVVVLAGLAVSARAVSAAGVLLPPDSVTPQIASAQLQDSSLVVSVVNAGAGTVQLLDRRGLVLATSYFGALAEVTPVAVGSAVETRFDGVLPRLLVGAPLYSLRLLPSSTTAVADWPFAVTLSCTPEFCRPHLQPGVAPGAGTRWAEPALAAYLDTASPGQPVLEGALSAGLIGPALDFGRVVAAESISAPGACQCTFVFDALPPTKNFCNDGLELEVSAENVTGERRLEAHRVHQVSLALPLRCYSRVGLSSYKTLVKSGTWQSLLEAPVPSLVPCSRPCSAGQPNFQLLGEARIDLQLPGAGGETAADASWQVRVTPQTGSAFSAADSRVTNWAPVEAARSLAWTGGSGRLDVEVDLRSGVSLGGDHQSGWARSAVNLHILTEATSLCGDVASGSGLLDLSGPKGTFGSPDADPTQISILIGGGCRP